MSLVLPRQKNVKLDEVFTPKEAIFPLLPFIKGMKVWECASGSGELAKHLRNEGFEVVEGNNFFNEVFDADVIVTNPPYSLKEKFLERAYALKKPFALLLPLTTFESKKRQRLFQEFGVQVIFLDKRINFETPSGNGSGSWFATAWFTNGLSLPREINFASLEQQRLKEFL